MKSIKIYYGPKKGFKELLPKRTEKVTLTQLAIKSDAENRKHIFRIEGQTQKDEVKTDEALEKIKCLVAYSEEYTGISEHAIHNFISFISQYDIGRIFLQNPPLYITQQLEKIGKKIDEGIYPYKGIDMEVLLRINNEYDANIIGQEKVKDYLLTALYPLTKENYQKPVVLLFYGPTGVGKTETAKFLSDVLGQKLFRKQFSMYHSSDFSSYLFGGKHSENSFAKELLERESNIILLDEFDKPHSVFHSAFYQLFDEGIFEDKNYRVTVNNSIIICTSNYTSIEDIKNHLGDPIFARFDAIIKFEPLSLDALEQIINIQFETQYKALSDDEKKLVDQTNIKDRILSWANTLKNAREIKKIIREAISTILVRELIKSNQNSGR
jgi:ATP-dependent Clp protease ATP-binding subunit ClpA